MSVWSDDNGQRLFAVTVSETSVRTLWEDATMFSPQAHCSLQDYLNGTGTGAAIRAEVASELSPSAAAEIESEVWRLLLLHPPDSEPSPGRDDD